MSVVAITPRQQAFIRSLIEERAVVLGIDDIDAYITAQRIGELTGRSASQLIDHLKGIAVPASSKPEHAHLPESQRIIVNKFAKDCELCGHSVSAGGGWACQTSAGWRTYHRAGECVEQSAVKTVVVAKRAYRLADGTIGVAYTTQNGNLAMRRLVIDEDNKGSLEYWKGGVAIVRSEGVELTQEEASSLGRTYGWCVNCCRPLSEDQSLSVGYGETCARNNDWFYPTKREAQDILGRNTSL